MTLAAATAGQRKFGYKAAASSQTGGGGGDSEGSSDAGEEHEGDGDPDEALRPAGAWRVHVRVRRRGGTQGF